MRIEVTQDDIEQGIPCDSVYCPIGRAIERTTGREAGVTDIFLRIGRHDENPHYVRPVPQAMIAFMHAFDSRQPVEPIAFDLAYERGQQ